MVQFQDQWFDGQRNLVITSTKSDHKVTLAVNQPLASPSPPKLTVSYHERNWTPEYDLPSSKVWTLQPGLKHEPSTAILPTLGNRIIDDEKPLREGMIYEAVFASLFTYDRNVDIVQAFCEAWCPRTNTLITSSSEMSISLRDLYMLGELPLLGDTYDERIPNALDLAKGSHKCCACLFKAFFHLTQQEGHNTYVQASQWIDLWCRKTRKYAAPPPRKENKKSRPKATHNPSGILEATPRWSHVSEAPFVELNIPQNLEQEVYLAAFLACWLCTFVLPGNPTATIRLETFNMACKMAKGIKVCLAPPVLASIYYGLNSISESISPGQMGTPFPIHYVYGWLSAYFNTHFKTPSLMSSSPKMVTSSGEGGAKYYDKIDARKRIFKGECVSWLFTSRQNGRDFFFFVMTREGAKRILNISYVCALVFLFYAKDVNVKLSLMYPIASVVSLDSTKHLPPTINYKAWLVDVHANLLENRVKDIVINGDPNVTVREGITQEQRDQLDTLRKGKAPVQDAPHDQVLEHATQKRREEQVRHRSSDEDVDSDRNFKRNRRPSNEGSAGLHVSNDAGSSNQHSSIGEVEHSDISESLNQVVASHQSLPPSNPPHQEAQPEPSHVSILPGADSFMIMIRYGPSTQKRCQLKLKLRSYVWQSALKDAQQKLSETQTLLSEKQKILEDSDGQVTLLEEAIKEVEKTIKEAEKTIKDSREELTKIRDEMPKLQELVTKAREQRNTSQEVVNSAEETVKRIQETPMLTSEDEDKLSLAEKDLETDKEDLMNFRIV
nr:ABC transporter G family member 11 [Ipomoea batatas]